MGKLKNLNGSGEDLTVEELRTYPGFENFSDEEAENYVRTIKELSLLLFFSLQRRKKDALSIDNQQDMTIFASNKAA
jgi:hypothetical protein